MLRRLSLTLLLAVPLSAQFHTVGTSIGPPLAIVEAGEVRVFRTVFQERGVVTATELRIRYEIEGDSRIERIDTTDGWRCTLAGNSADCTKTSNPPFQLTSVLDLTVRVGSDNGSAVMFSMTGTIGPVDAPISKSEAALPLQFYLSAVVDTVADSGPGSLRTAIEQANGANRPAKIAFRIPPPVPAEGWFTLIPASPLPPITNERVFVDGKTQTQFLGDTNPLGPEVAIDGRLAHHGLEIHSRCLARVEGLAIGNFDANQGLWFTKNGTCETYSFFTDERLVADNYIGTDPTGTVAWPNLRGLRGDFGSGTIRNNLISGNTYSGMWIWVTSSRSDSFTIEGNKFGTAADGIAPLPNGAAGMLLGDRVSADVRQNVIANHPGMGIALVRGETYVQIRQNSMRDNGGVGIDWGIDGKSQSAIDDSRTSDPDAPALLSARYDAESNRTYFTVRSTSRHLFRVEPSYFFLDFYANRGPDGDGEQWIDKDHAGLVTNQAAFEAWVPGELRGKWVNATITLEQMFFLWKPRFSSELVTFGDESTSEFSNAILVP